MMQGSMHVQTTSDDIEATGVPDARLTNASGNEESHRMTDPESSAPNQEGTSAEGLVAVVVDLLTPAFLEKIGPALQNLPHQYSIVITTPVDQQTAVTDLALRLGLEARILLSGVESTPAQRLLQILEELGERHHAYFCRLVELTSAPSAGQVECPFDALIGNAELVEKISSSFVHNPSLAILGCAIDRVSMRSNTPPGLTKLSLATPAVVSGQPTPWDWGYFASGCFWGRISAFLPYLQLPYCATPSEPPSHLKSVNSWAQAFERLFGLVAHMTEGKLGLVDYPIGTKHSSPVVRILDRDHDVGIRSLSARKQAMTLLRKGMLERYLLLRSSDLLDPLWYYRQHLSLTRQWDDCLLHHLEHPHTFLSQAHQQGETSYVIDATGMQVQCALDATSRLVTLPYRFLSELFLSDITAVDPPEAQGIKVSVICPTYNHERYLRECLDSILAQETDFDFEILVGDDASTDGTTKILQEYVQLHPQRIVAVQRQTNLGPVANSSDLLRRARGQYIALCEGDDYWINSGKLQAQVNHLDQHPRCAAHFHPVKVIDETAPSGFDVFPKGLDGQAFGTDQIVQTNFVPTNAVMYRRSERLLELFEANVSDTAMPLDWLGHIVASRLGELHMAQALMGVYRKHADGIWSQHTGATFLCKWGMQHLEFHAQAMRVTGTAHHSLWCQRLVALFGRLFHGHFLRQDATLLATLVCKHPGTADLFFGSARIAIKSRDVVDGPSMASALKSALRVSTIVLTHNSAAYLQQCLDSVSDQSGFFSHEIIIADDASNDLSLEISRRLLAQAGRNTKLLTSTQRIGAPSNFMRAVDACSGQFIAVCEGDDYWISPDKVAKQLAYMLGHPSAPMCFNWVMIDHDQGTKVPHPGQGKIEHDQIGFDDLLKEPLTANLSACFYRRDTIARLPDVVRNAASAGDWLLNLHAATLGPIGFLRDLLSAYRVHARGQWSGLSEARKAGLVRDCYSSFMDIFPAHAEQIATFIDESDSDIAVPTELAMRNFPGLRFHLDRLDCNPEFLLITGWLVQGDTGSHQHEEKILFITSKSGQVVHSQRMDNVMRPDVHRYYRDKLGISNLDFNWAGCKSLVIPALEDGEYRLAVALRHADGMAHMFLKPMLCIRGGIVDM